MTLRGLRETAFGLPMHLRVPQLVYNRGARYVNLYLPVDRKHYAGRSRDIKRNRIFYQLVERERQTILGSHEEIITL